ncbi:hypothetical protein B0H66DRAFT_621391 [Apodospora peruviana]|uniref:Uncharacterized protein n=1 Tax=Apodospora peruviana TaxID=516989 RepID=A0AAE0I451_9PEZI|nr:hypothetical protein B0H66DRAFT_618261 [Apodospora peruviana]KAK3317939.1 hypothetical protein B0H66DRAFT_621391 [Apodospora peruviana]
MSDTSQSNTGVDQPKTRCESPAIVVSSWAHVARRASPAVVVSSYQKPEEYDHSGKPSPRQTGMPKPRRADTPPAHRLRPPQTFQPGTQQQKQTFTPRPQRLGTPQPSGRPGTPSRYLHYGATHPDQHFPRPDQHFPRPGQHFPRALSPYPLGGAHIMPYYPAQSPLPYGEVRGIQTPVRANSPFPYPHPPPLSRTVSPAANINPPPPPWREIAHGLSVGNLRGRNTYKIDLLQNSNITAIISLVKSEEVSPVFTLSAFREIIPTDKHLIYKVVDSSLLLPDLAEICDFIDEQRAPRARIAAQTEMACAFDEEDDVAFCGYQVATVAERAAEWGRYEMPSKDKALRSSELDMGNDPCVLIHAVSSDYGNLAAVIGIAYLMRLRRRGFDETYEYVRSKYAETWGTLTSLQREHVEQLRLWKAVRYDIFLDDEHVGPGSPPMRLHKLEYTQYMAGLVDKEEPRASVLTCS